MRRVVGGGEGGRRGGERRERGEKWDYGRF